MDGWTTNWEEAPRSWDSKKARTCRNLNLTWNRFFLTNCLSVMFNSTLSWRLVTNFGELIPLARQRLPTGTGWGYFWIAWLMQQHMPSWTLVGCDWDALFQRRASDTANDVCRFIGCCLPSHSAAWESCVITSVLVAVGSVMVPLLGLLFFDNNVRAFCCLSMRPRRFTGIL